MASGVKQSQVSPKFLHSNSTSHTWVFSAMAELIDNACDTDVRATDLWINKEIINGTTCLTFLDNGCGMTYPKLYKMLSFGYSEKEDEGHYKAIGKYGNGFKSGSMRLGRDAVVITRCHQSMSVGFLSQTYLEGIDAETVLVPIVTWDITSRGLTRKSNAENNQSLKAILEFSPFKTEEELKEHIGENVVQYGTKIVIYNLKRANADNLELDFVSDPEDIRNPETAAMDPSATERRRSACVTAPEYRRSLRVENMSAELAKKKGSNYHCCVPNCNADGRYDTETSFHKFPKDDELRQQWIIKIKKDPGNLFNKYCTILYMKPRMKIFLRNKKVQTTYMPKSLSKTEEDVYSPHWNERRRGVILTFGFTRDKSENAPYGLILYHKNRLIEAYTKVGCQNKGNGEGAGVVCVVEADFLETEHNKQAFSLTSRYRSLINNISKKLKEYYDAKKRRKHTTAETSTEQECVSDWVQCDNCRSWRRLPIGHKVDISGNWYCHNNPDPHYNRCEIPEEAEGEDEGIVLPKPSYMKTARKEKVEKKKQAKLEEGVIQNAEAAETSEEIILYDRSKDTPCETTLSQSMVRRAGEEIEASQTPAKVPEGSGQLEGAVEGGVIMGVAMEPADAERQCAVNNMEQQSLLQESEMKLKAVKEKKRLDYKIELTAQEEKAQGDYFFEQEKYQDAYKHYTEAAKRNPYDAEIKTSKDACEVKMKEYSVALAECHPSLFIGPNSMKSFLQEKTKKRLKEGGGSNKSTLNSEKRNLKDKEEQLRRKEETLKTKSTTALEETMLSPQTSGNQDTAKTEEEENSTQARPAVKLLGKRKIKDTDRDEIPVKLEVPKSTNADTGAYLTTAIDSISTATQNSASDLSKMHTPTCKGDNRSLSCKTCNDFPSGTLGLNSTTIKHTISLPSGAKKVGTAIAETNTITMGSDTSRIVGRPSLISINKTVPLTVETMNLREPLITPLKNKKTTANTDNWMETEQSEKDVFLAGLENVQDENKTREDKVFYNKDSQTDKVAENSESESEIKLLQDALKGERRALIHKTEEFEHTQRALNSLRTNVQELLRILEPNTNPGRLENIDNVLERLIQVSRTNNI